MRLLILPVVLASVLTGCASYEQQREMARNKSTDDLCYASVTKPRQKRAAEDELSARGAACDWQKVQMMMQAEHMRQAEINASLQQLQGAAAMYQANQPRPLAPMPAPSMMNCRSVHQGMGVVQTVCH